MSLISEKISFVFVFKMVRIGRELDIERNIGNSSKNLTNDVNKLNLDKNCLQTKKCV